MQEDLPSTLPTREEFMALLWERASDKALARHPSTIRYVEMFAKYKGWDKPDPHQRQSRVVFEIGGDVN